MLFFIVLCSGESRLLCSPCRWADCVSATYFKKNKSNVHNRYISTMSLVNCHICQLNSFEAGRLRIFKLEKLNLCIIFHINPSCLQTCGILISQMAVTHLASHLATSDILTVQWTVKNSPKVIFQVFSHFAQVQIGEKGTMAAGGGSQLSLITLEGSCVAKARQLPSSWLRVWEPARKAKMHFTPLQAYAWSLSVSFSFSLTPLSSLFLFHTCTQKHSKIAENCTKSSTFTPLVKL